MRVAIKIIIYIISPTEQDTGFLILQEPFYLEIKALDQNSYVRKRLKMVYKSCFLKHTVLLS